MSFIQIQQLNRAKQLNKTEQGLVKGGRTPQDKYWSNFSSGKTVKYNGRYYSSDRAALIPTDGKRTFYTDGNGFIESTVNGKSEDILDIRGALIL